MRGRALLACTAIVVAAHAALLASLARHGWHGPLAATDAATPARRIVILDAARVAALTASPPADAVAPAASSAQDAPSAPADDAASAPARAIALARRTPTPGLGIYRPPEALDTPVRPRSSPDVSTLNGLTWSGLPLRLRLFIDAEGRVTDVQALASAEQPDVLEKVRQMFLATGFTMGTENGRPVSSFKDIEVDVGRPLPAPASAPGPG